MLLFLNLSLEGFPPLFHHLLDFISFLKSSPGFVKSTFDPGAEPQQCCASRIHDPQPRNINKCGQSKQEAGK